MLPLNQTDQIFCFPQQQKEKLEKRLYSLKSWDTATDIATYVIGASIIACLYYFNPNITPITAFAVSFTIFPLGNYLRSPYLAQKNSLEAQILREKDLIQGLLNLKLTPTDTKYPEKALKLRIEFKQLDECLILAENAKQQLSRDRSLRFIDLSLADKTPDITLSDVKVALLDHYNNLDKDLDVEYLLLEIINMLLKSTSNDLHTQHEILEEIEVQTRLRFGPTSQSLAGQRQTARDQIKTYSDILKQSLISSL
jgi:hypothetical protein